MAKHVARRRLHHVPHLAPRLERGETFWSGTQKHERVRCKARNFESRLASRIAFNPTKTVLTTTLKFKIKTSWLVDIHC